MERYGKNVENFVEEWIYQRQYWGIFLGDDEIDVVNIIIEVKIDIELKDIIGIIFDSRIIRSVIR